jgi:Domain of unknown function (DUF4115)
MAVHASPHDASPACPACGAPSPHGAAFCSRCGQPLRDSRPRPGRLAYEACTVARWRGYVTSRFYAATDDGAVVFESKPFRWRKAESPPEEGAVREAYDELVRALERQGWRRASVGDLWWASRFTRGVPLPAAEPAVVYAEPLPLPEPPVVAEAPPLPQPMQEQPAPAPAPPVADEPVPVPVETSPRPRRLRWSRRRVLFAAVWLLTVPAAAFLILTTVPRGNAAPATGTVAHMVVPERPAAATPAPVPAKVVVRQKPKAAAAPHVAKRTPRLVVTGSDRASWLEIRRGSATGTVLFSGELAAGRRIAFNGARLWGRFGAAANVAISFDGRRVPLQGTIEHLFAASK